MSTPPPTPTSSLAPAPSSLSTSGPSHQRGRLWVVLVVCVVVLWPLRHFSEQRRDELMLRPRTTAEAAGLWETVLTSGTGAFRAFANLAIWKQITDAEDAREYYRLIELYRTVQRLQPRNVRAQRYLADQLIDLIAARAATRERAWDWVERGMLLLDSSVERSPYAERLHDALGVFYLRKMADYPVRILRFEVAKPIGTGSASDSLLGREPLWLELAKQTLADYDALTQEERDQLQHAVGRIGYALAFSRNVTEFSEFNRLSHRARHIFRRFNVLRNALSLLAYERGTDPRFGVGANDIPRLGRYAALRVDDLLAMRQAFADPDEAMRTIWRVGIRCYLAVDGANVTDRFSRQTARRMLRNLQQVWEDYPIPADTETGREAARLFGGSGAQ